MHNPLDGLPAPILLAGIGNPLKSDDGAGPALVERLTALAAEIPTIDCGETPENFMGKMASSGARTIVFADAVEMGREPGAVRLFSADEIEPAGASTHAMPLSLLADFLRAETNAEIYLLGIQPGNVGFGEGLTPAVERAVDKLSAAIAGGGGDKE